MKHPLSRLRLLVCVPLGMLWLGVIAVMAVPVILFMTALYYLSLGGRAVVAGWRALQGAARDEA